MAATAWLREVTRHNRLVKRVDGVLVDARDEDDCEELLRRLAKQHGVKAGDCELTVKSGITTRKYRV